MDPFTTKKPFGPSSNGAYSLGQPKARQHTAPRPIDEAKAAALKVPTTSFDPSKPSFKPVKSLKSLDHLDDIVAKRKEDVKPEQKRIQALEDAMTIYNGSHQLQLAEYVDQAEVRSEKLAEQAEQIKAQAEKARGEAEKAQEKAEMAQEKAEKTQAQTSRVEGQAEQTASKISSLQNILRDDFRIIKSQIQSGGTEVRELTARLEAAEQERSWTAAHMKIKTLAEAESHELMARRLRESVLGPDGHGQLQGGMARLQLTAEPSQQQANGTVESPVSAQEPVELESPYESTVRGVDAVAPEPKTQVTDVEHQDILAVWRPHAISQITPLIITAANDQTFTWEDLHRYLGGAQYSPGLYLASNDFENSILKGKTFWLLEAQLEPFAPKAPGQHGAKLTAFFNDSPTENGLVPEEEDYSNVPLFICPAEGKGYTYLGTYSQTRYSDKLSHSEVFQRVPEHVLEYWTALLADPERPAWVTEQLIAHFWPAPTYAGPIPTNVAIATPATGASNPRDPEAPLEKRVVRALEEFAHELRDWKKESQLKVQLLTEEALMEMWKKSDLDEEKGMRPWLEYLECVGFDSEFYERLVAAKQTKGKTIVAKAVVASKGEPSMAGSATPRANGDKGEQRRESAADVPELKLDESPIKEAKFKRTKHPAPEARQGRSITRC
jgi:hypothetical protein